MERNQAEHLFLKNTRLAYAILYRYYSTQGNSEDLQQEALLGLWRACLTYDPTKGTFSTYAGVCIRNQICIALREEAKQLDTVSLNTPIIDCDGLIYESFIEDPCPRTDPGWVALKEYLKGLPPRDRQIVQRRIEGYTQKEIAEELGLSKAYCCQRLKRLLKDYLKQEDQE